VVCVESNDVFRSSGVPLTYSSCCGHDYSRDAFVIISAKLPLTDQVLLLEERLGKVKHHILPSLLKGCIHLLTLPPLV